MTIAHLFWGEYTRTPVRCQDKFDPPHLVQIFKEMVHEIRKF